MKKLNLVSSFPSIRIQAMENTAYFYQGVGKYQIERFGDVKGKQVIGMLVRLKDFLQTYTKSIEENKKIPEDDEDFYKVKKFPFLFSWMKGILNFFKS